MNDMRAFFELLGGLQGVDKDYAIEQIEHCMKVTVVLAPPEDARAVLVAAWEYASGLDETAAEQWLEDIAD